MSKFTIFVIKNKIWEVSLCLLMYSFININQYYASSGTLKERWILCIEEVTRSLRHHELIIQIQPIGVIWMFKSGAFSLMWSASLIWRLKFNLNPFPKISESSNQTRWWFCNDIITSSIQSLQRSFIHPFLIKGKKYKAYIISNAERYLSWYFTLWKYFLLRYFNKKNILVVTKII